MYVIDVEDQYAVIVQKHTETSFYVPNAIQQFHLLHIPYQFLHHLNQYIRLHELPGDFYYH
jgi:fatty acid desaturase